jgi:hypothetical protein
VFSSANVVEQAGASTTTGAVINLGSTALTSSAVFTKTAAYLSGTQTEVASNTSTYLFNGESSTNASIIDTLATVENATGTNLADYIVGSASANTITAGAGVDFITSGTGADTIVVTTVAAANYDLISDFTVGSGLERDVINAPDGTFAWFGDGAANSDGVTDLISSTTVKAAKVADDQATIYTISTNSAANTFDDFLAGTDNEATMEGKIVAGMGDADGTVAADHLIIAIDDGEHTGIFKFESAGVSDDAGDVTAAEITLMVILEGVTDATTLTVDNFSFV